MEPFCCNINRKMYMTGIQTRYGDLMLLNVGLPSVTLAQIYASTDLTHSILTAMYFSGDLHFPIFQLFFNYFSTIW